MALTRLLALASCTALLALACATPAASLGASRAQAASPTLPRPVRLARNHAAHSRHLRAAQVRVVSYVRRTWPDGCLGIAAADVMCTQELVAGYRAVFVVRAKRVAYRTDLHDRYRVEP
ncbi:MAG: hypothetical protein QOG56_1510 [Solirubrobacteraceae bacterium]|nr:hypothetical protein [Solirubrobacteraceae bacterium]